LRVAILVDQFPRLSETFVAEEAMALRRRGHAVRVEARTRSADPNPAVTADLPVHRMADDGLPRKLVDLVWLAARHPLACARDLIERRRWRREEEVRPLRSLAPVARRVERAREQHLHAHFAAWAALDAMRLSRLLGIPYSVATHGYDIYREPRNLREKHERAAFAVTDCEYSLAHLRSLTGARHGARIHKLVLGVDGERFRRRGPAAAEGQATVLAVGRLTEKKGFRHLLEAVAQARASVPMTVRIVGGGELRDELEALISGLDLDGTVELLGPLPPAKVRDLLESADLLAMPCVVARNGDRDTMPVVVKEALAMEVPVVASDEVGLPEAVRLEWGRLVPPADAPALARAIVELLELSPERRGEMGRAGRAWVLEHASLERETEKLVELIRSTGSPRAGGPRPGPARLGRSGAVAR
jgi:glycosyltransferase involved in cell wall biosynthesis